MEMVLLTALGVGGATLIGVIIGFIFKNISHRFSDIVLSFAAGVMLAAAVLGLILPSVEYGGKFGLIYAVTGIFAGAFALNLIDKLVPHLHALIFVYLYILFVLTTVYKTLFFLVTFYYSGNILKLLVTFKFYLEDSVILYFDHR